MEGGQNEKRIKVGRGTSRVYREGEPKKKRKVKKRDARRDEGRRDSGK